MPTYEYECRKCGHRFERFQSMTAKPLRSCPRCRGRVQRLVGTGAGILFKGSGFYQTDYRSESYRKAARQEKSGGDSKPAEEKSKTAGADGGKEKPASKADKE